MNPIRPDESFREINDRLAREEEKRVRRKKTILIMTGAVLAAVLIGFFTVELGRFTKYCRSRELHSAGSYGNAVQGLEELGDYQNSRDLLSDCYGNLAREKMTRHEWDAARAYFLKAAEINGQYYQIQEAYMKEGRFKRKNGDWEGAAEAFSWAGDYRDAKEQVRQTRLQQAQALSDAGDPEGAAAILGMLRKESDVTVLPDTQ